MKLGVLYSGGKDSTLALLKAKEFHKIACLITLVSANKESYMFQTPNVHMTELQAEAMGLPLVSVATEGEKELELIDLKRAIAEAVSKHRIEGIVTGAVRSTYQASRIQRICHELGLWCFNPLWLMDQVALLDEIVKAGIVAIISGVFAEPLDKSFLGKVIDKAMAGRLAAAAETHGINPAGEGGEIETTVLHAPGFKKSIIVKKSYASFDGSSGVYHIHEAELK
ncbi:diphthine--ammonia ligase [Candidatus Woesearchaeota archaeon]|nr:diphthine--ammonia ligase [Candidatus Woesearchaeota archaeon]